VPASLCPARGSGKLALDVEERRTRDVPREVELVPAIELAELPAAVDELIAQARSLESVAGWNLVDRLFWTAASPGRKKRAY
jgi:hypothetical protein